MKYIPLIVLDEYAKRLSNSQVNKLYEAKTNKKYKKALFENSAAPKYKLYLDGFTIAEELESNSAEFAMWLNENYKDLMSNISYSLKEDSINFSTTSKNNYKSLLEALRAAGIHGDVIESIVDKNF